MHEPLNMDVIKILLRDLGKPQVIDLIMGALGDIKSRLKQLQDMIAKEDRRQICYLAHSIKSNLNTIGAEKTAEIAQQIETASLSAPLERLGSLKKELEDSFSDVEPMVLQLITSPAF